jgi:hypothetical protein
MKHTVIQNRHAGASELRENPDDTMKEVYVERADQVDDTYRAG